jgi:hypothetical protein
VVVAGHVAVRRQRSMSRNRPVSAFLNLWIFGALPNHQPYYLSAISIRAKGRRRHDSQEPLQRFLNEVKALILKIGPLSRGPDNQSRQVVN